MLNFTKPDTGSSKLHSVAANTITAASGARDSDRCVACAQREWQLSVLSGKIVTLLCDEVRISS